MATSATDIQPRIVDLKTVLVRDDEGHPVAMVGVGTDVTARSQIEDALRASEERYRTAFQTSLDCIAIIRLADDRILDANQTFLDTLGYVREEVLNRSKRPGNAVLNVG